MRMLVGAGLAGLAAFVLVTAPAAGDDAAGSPALADETVRVRADYAGSVWNIRVGRIAFDASLSGEDYTASTHIEAAGLAALFADFEIEANARGRRLETGWRPLRYAHVERNEDKVRTVDVRFPRRVAMPVAEPDFSSWGDPPASESDRAGALDPVTAVFSLAEAYAELSPAAACSGRMPVFDGKQRYDLRLVDGGRDRIRTRAWRGEAHVCHAYYEPISGYDPEDWPTERELRRPLTFWIAPLADGRVYLPVRAATRAGFGVRVEALDIIVE